MVPTHESEKWCRNIDDKEVHMKYINDKNIMVRIKTCNKPLSIIVIYDLEANKPVHKHYDNHQTLINQNNHKEKILRQSILMSMGNNIIYGIK